MTALKLLPLLSCWGFMVLALARACPGKRTLAAAAVGFGAGAAAENLLLATMGGETPFRLLRGICGVVFLLLWALALRVAYRGGAATASRGAAGRWAPLLPAVAACTGTLAGGIALCRMAPLDGGAVGFLPCIALAMAGALPAAAGSSLGGRVPERLTPGAAPLAALLVSGILFMACSVPRLDLFSPLSMEVMKFVHDFVHQFFESMLIPDHPFFRSDVWGYIGFLFSDRVGFWGGLAIWYAPVLLVALAVRLQRLPSVAHIRQGAERRKLLAGFIRNRRLQLAAPLAALVLLSAAAYRSRFPSVEYWDPKPIAVTATASGEILIPKQGETPLEDGKLHKYVYRQGGREARFFLVLTPSGRLTASLDACAICKPDGYGQSGKMVLCYYCKTLIPLDTVGKPGGCNPVPVRSSTKGDAVSIDGTELLNKWGDTVQETSRVKEGGR